MPELITVAVIVFLIFLLVRAILFLSRRISLLVRLLRLRKIDGVSLSIVSPLSLLRAAPGKRPFARVSVSGKVYCVRLLSGGGIRRWFHFASERYAVRFSRMKTVGTAKDLPGERPVGVRSLSVGGKLVTVPPLPEAAGETEALLFSPMPGILTYVTEKKTSIRIALTGDTAFGREIYGIRSFCRMIDRASREVKSKRTFFEE